MKENIVFFLYASHAFLLLRTPLAGMSVSCGTVIFFSSIYQDEREYPRSLTLYHCVRDGKTLNVRQLIWDKFSN